MAKTKKISGELEYIISPKSVNTVFVHKDSNPATIELKYNDTNTKYNYIPFVTRKGNNLVVKTYVIKMYSSNMYKKTITTTFKDYFSDENFNSIYNDKSLEERCAQKNVTLTENKEYILASSDKNASLVLSEGGSDWIYDTKGNDNYTLEYNYYNEEENAYTGTDVIIEASGNDIYNLKDGNRAYVVDIKGSDKYFASENKAIITVWDCAGNDKYKAGNQGVLSIDDGKGNDKYYLNNKSRGIISDSSGKDYYEITDSFIYLDDLNGKDEYIIKDCTELEYIDLFIQDSGKYNDTYNFNNIKYKSFTENEETDEDYCNIIDTSGNDKFYLASVENMVIGNKYGDDKYTINNSESITVKDIKGKDKYTITDSNNILIADGHGNDKYKAYVTSSEKTSSDIDIIDYKGKDSYTFSNCTNIGIEDYGGKEDKYNLTNCSFSIEDGYYVNSTHGIFSPDEYKKCSKDTYIIKNCDTYGYIRDEGGSDKYKIDGINAEIQIYDYGAGKKDTLEITGVNKNDIVYMTNIDEDGFDCDLILYNKSTGGYISIDLFYETDEDEENIIGYSKGRIETIKINNKSIKTGKSLYTNFNNIKEEVITWLKDTVHESVEDILTSDDTTAKEQLIAYFTGNN